MKIKLDENMPTALVQILSDLGHDVDTVPSEGLGGSTDSQVWSADWARCFVVTSERKLRVRRPGKHRK